MRAHRIKAYPLSRVYPRKRNPLCIRDALVLVLWPAEMLRSKISIEWHILAQNLPKPDLRHLCTTTKPLLNDTFGAIFWRPESGIYSLKYHEFRAQIVAKPVDFGTFGTFLDPKIDPFFGPPISKQRSLTSEPKKSAAFG